jgi:hypothetical protein
MAVDEISKPELMLFHVACRGFDGADSVKVGFLSARTEREKKASKNREDGRSCLNKGRVEVLQR